MSRQYITRPGLTNLTNLPNPPQRVIEPTAAIIKTESTEYFRELLTC